MLGSVDTFSAVIRFATGGDGGNNGEDAPLDASVTVPSGIDDASLWRSTGARLDLGGVVFLNGILAGTSIDSVEKRLESEDCCTWLAE